MERMTPQHETFYSILTTYRFSEVRSAKFYGRRDKLLAIVRRGKVDPTLTFYTMWFHIRSAACPLRTPHRFREITITRGFHPWPGAQGANLVSAIWSITGSDTEPVQETAVQMSFETMGTISRGILIPSIIKISHQQVNNEESVDCASSREWVEDETYQ